MARVVKAAAAAAAAAAALLSLLLLLCGGRTALATPGMLVAQRSSSTRFQYGYYNGGGVFAPAASPTTNMDGPSIAHRLCARASGSTPETKVMMARQRFANTAGYHIALFNGKNVVDERASHLSSASPATGDATSEPLMDCAFEDVSGNPLLLFATKSTQNFLHYSELTSGSIPNGQFSTKVPDDIAATFSEAYMVLAESLPYTDAIVVGLTMETTRNRALVWSGSAWGNVVSLGSRTNDVKYASALGVVCDALGGSCLVLHQRAAATTALGFAEWSGSAWKTTAGSIAAPGSPGKGPRYLATAAHRTLRAVCVGVLHYGGGAWAALGTRANANDAWTWHQSALYADASDTDNHRVAVAFEQASARCMLIVGDGDSGKGMLYARSTTATGASPTWSALAKNGIDASNVGELKYVAADGDPSPISNDIYVVSRDADADVARGTLWDGSSWTPAASPIMTLDATVNPGDSPFAFMHSVPAPPTPSPTASPTATPTSAPSSSPTPAPTAPTSAPSAAPSTSPSAAPSVAPSTSPSAAPSVAPSTSPSSSPIAPTDAPSAAPSASPSTSPSSSPIAPTGSPSAAPSNAPSLAPSSSPIAPTGSPSAAPSNAPSLTPSSSPLGPSASPSAAPSRAPSAAPSRAPSAAPSLTPSAAPSDAPSTAPSAAPSAAPSRAPSDAPSLTPSAAPSLSPSAAPIGAPSTTPTAAPTDAPSHTAAPSAAPTLAPSAAPLSVPSAAPTATPTTAPVPGAGDELVTPPPASPAGAIAGALVAVLCCVALIVALVVVALRRRKQQQRERNAPPPPAVIDADADDGTELTPQPDSGVASTLPTITRTSSGTLQRGSSSGAGGGVAGAAGGQQRAALTPALRGGNYASTALARDGSTGASSSPLYDRVLDDDGDKNNNNNNNNGDDADDDDDDNEYQHPGAALMGKKPVAGITYGQLAPDADEGAGGQYGSVALVTRGEPGDAAYSPAPPAPGADEPAIEYGKLGIAIAPDNDNYSSLDTVALQRPNAPAAINYSALP